LDLLTGFSSPTEGVEKDILILFFFFFPASPQLHLPSTCSDSSLWLGGGSAATGVDTGASLVGEARTLRARVRVKRKPSSSSS
jgi:hypothetical protein